MAGLNKDKGKATKRAGLNKTRGLDTLIKANVEEAEVNAKYKNSIARYLMCVMTSYTRTQQP